MIRETQYRLSVYKDQWHELRPWTVSRAILAGKTNSLGIVAKGADFTLFINDQKVDQVKDTTLSSGRVGLVIETHGILPATFEFDNLELRRSPEAPGAPPAGK